MTTMHTDLLAAIPNLPCLLPDETLYSWCGAVHMWNGNVSALETSRQLFGSPYSGLLHDFPSRLADLDKRTGSLLGPIDTLALRHTLLGYFLAWVEEARAKEMIDATCNAGAPHLKMQLGITASRVGGLHPLKGCPDCFEDDERAHGRAFWRVSQQFPSAVVCVKHRTPLHIVRHDNTPVHRRGWILPKAGLIKDWLPTGATSANHLRTLIRLAAFSAQAARCPPASFSPECLASTYQSALQARGALSKGGSLRASRLDDLMRTTYGRWPEVIVKSPCLQTLAGDRVLPHVYRHKGAGTLLCLWWPKNREWTSQMKLSDTFIPWTVDWLWYFEEWLYTGEWAGGGEHPSGTSRMSDRRRRLSSP